MHELPAADRAALRRSIDADRARTTARAAALERDFANIVEVSADAVRDDEHDPEGATIAFERAQVSALLADARRHLADLDRAVARLDEPHIGICEGCGNPIALERLLARPAATRCVSCAK